MSADAQLQSQIDAATVYEQDYVPVLFAPFAPHVIAAARIRAGQRVLDVACGTGIVARHAAAAVEPGGSVAALDLNPGMIAVARRLAPGIDFHEGTAEALPFAAGAFDAVVSQFGLMFFSDRRRALREMARVLAPGGRVAIGVWDRLEHTPAYADEVAICWTASQAAGRGMRCERRSHSGETPVLAALFDDVGLNDVSIETRSFTVSFPSIRVLVEADLRGWLPCNGRQSSRREDRRDPGRCGTDAGRIRRGGRPTDLRPRPRTSSAARRPDPRRSLHGSNSAATSLSHAPPSLISHQEDEA